MTCSRAASGRGDAAEPGGADLDEQARAQILVGAEQRGGLIDGPARSGLVAPGRGGQGGGGQGERLGVGGALALELLGGGAGEPLGRLGLPGIEPQDGQRQPALRRGPLLAQLLAQRQRRFVPLPRLLQVPSRASDLAEAEERVGRGAPAAGVAAERQGALEAPAGRRQLSLLQQHRSQVVQGGHLADLLPDLPADAERLLVAPAAPPRGPRACAGPRRGCPGQ